MDMIVRRFTVPLVLAYSPTPYSSGLKKKRRATERLQLPVLKQKLCQFYVNHNNAKVIVHFCPATDEPGDLFKMTVTNESEEIVAESEFPYCRFDFHPGSYTVRCTTTSGPVNEELDGSSPMKDLISYCMQNPDLLLTFKCGDEEIKAVASIMCSLSPVVEAMMKYPCVESRSKSINVPLFSAKVVRLMVEFCHSRNIVEFEGYELALCEISNFFDIKPLKEFAANRVAWFFDKDNLLEIYRFSQIHDNPYLASHCLRFAPKPKPTACLDYSNVDANLVKTYWEAVRQLRSSKDGQLQMQNNNQYW